MIKQCHRKSPSKLVRQSAFGTPNQHLNFIRKWALRRSKESKFPTDLTATVHEKCVHLDSTNCQVYVTHLPAGCMSRLFVELRGAFSEKSAPQSPNHDRKSIRCSPRRTRAFGLTFSSASESHLGSTLGLGRLKNIVFLSLQMSAGNNLQYQSFQVKVW